MKIAQIYITKSQEKQKEDVRKKEICINIRLKIFA